MRNFVYKIDNGQLVNKEVDDNSYDATLKSGWFASPVEAQNKIVKETNEPVKKESPKLKPEVKTKVSHRTLKRK